jgi:SAM-dependent methyltransferase
MSERRFYELPTSDQRRHAPAAARNVEAIGDVLADWLPSTGTVIEVASGTGEHVIALARRFANLAWQPSESHPEALASIIAWRAAENLPNVATPLLLDVRSADWNIPFADAVLSINLVHISPWDAALGLLAGAARLLRPGAPLVLYGPWFQRGVDPAPSNLAFDADLRRRDPQWGIRQVEGFVGEAAARGFDFAEKRAMPANNVMLLLRRR